MKIYSTEMMLCGTIYVLAENEKQALEIMRDFSNDTFEFRGDAIFGGSFQGHMPEVSLSPAFTGHGLCEDHIDAVEVVETLEVETDA